MTDEQAGGWATTYDGRHIPISKEDAAALWESIERSIAKRAEDMPDTTSALNALCAARERLRELGWRDGIYCPKDGSDFAVIQFGSSGIFTAFYCGKWPEGEVWLADSSYPPQGLLWKALTDLTDAERVNLAECMEAERIMQDRQLRSFADDPT